MRLALAAVAPLLLACTAEPGGRALALYTGSYTDESLPEDIALLQPIDFEDARLVAVAYDHRIARPHPSLSVELEGNVAHWFNEQDHTEFNGLLFLRWLDLPWDRWIDTSVGIGNGLSWATDEPLLEQRFHQDTGATRLLYHTAIDISVAIPGAKGWEGFLRVHHRSGVYGTFDDVNGGSNVIGFGLRHWF